MKKIFTLVFFLLFSWLEIKAQYQPLYSQNFNNFLLNPAVAGIEDHVEVQLSHRSQWQGIEGAPKTSFLSIHGSINKVDNNLKNRLPKNEAIRFHHGVGGVIGSDKIGPFQRNELQLSYACHAQLFKKLNLAAGISGGLQQQKFDVSKLGTIADLDPALSSSQLNYLQKQVTVGLWAYDYNYYVGIAVNRMFSTENENITHYTFSTAYRHALIINNGESLGVQPFMLLRYTSLGNLSADLGLRLLFLDNKLWVGGAYRSSGDLIGMIGLNITSLMSVNYSYDSGVAGISSFASGSHEIVLNFRLFNHNKVYCPQKLW